MTEYALGLSPTGVLKTNRRRQEGGDRDGVAVVPRQELDEIVNVLEEVKRAEAKMDEQVREGLEMKESITTLLQSDRVRYLD